MTVFFADIEPALRRHLEGVPSRKGESIHTRSGNRGGLLRLPLANGRSIIVKVWRFRTLKERLKAAVHCSNGQREWCLHRLVHRNDITVPEPLFFQNLQAIGLGPGEAMAIEDVGEAECGVPYLKKLITAGLDREITSFEDKVIDITSELLELKVLDVDNQLNNFLIDTAGRVWRVDFECARKRHWVALRRTEFAMMLDRLLRSHLHATHPESERTSWFMAKLATRLSIPADIRRLAGKIIQKELMRENRKTGIGYSVALDW